MPFPMLKIYKNIKFKITIYFDFYGALKAVILDSFTISNDGFNFHDTPCFKIGKFNNDLV